MTSVTLPPLLDLSAAVVLADTLRDLRGPIAIDGAAVERIGVAGIQVLLSASATAAAAGHALTIHAPSTAFRAAVLTVGAGVLLAAGR